MATIIRETTPVPVRQGRGGRLVALTVFGVLLLAGLGYLALAWFTSGRIPHGTSVEGIGIGGLSPAAAEQRLRDRLADRSNQALVLTWQDHTFRIDPGAAGMAIDYAATVQDAGGAFSLDPARIWRYFVGGDDLPARVSIVDASLGAQLARLAAVVDRAPVEGRITFGRGTAHPVWPRPGRALDRAAAREVLVHEFLHGGRGRVPVAPADPDVGAEAVQRAMREFALPAMKAPVVLVVGNQPVIATPREFSAALTMVPKGHELKPVVDGERLLRGIRPAMTTVGDTPRDARIRLLGGRPVLTPARIGATIDVQDLAARFPTYAARPPGHRLMHVKAVVQQPRFTTADARALGVTDVVAQASARVRAGDGAAATARSLTGRLLRPHQTLTVSAPPGAPSPGPSLVASTLYTAAFAAGLEVVERTPLPSYRAAFPLGVDARVDADHSLRLRNDTPYGVLLDVSARAGGPVTVRLWSTKAWDVTTATSPRRDIVASPVSHDRSAGCRPVTGTEGFTVTVTRTLRHDGEVADRHAFTSRYHPTRTVVCHRAGSDGGDGPVPVPTPPGDDGPGHGHRHGPPGPPRR